MCVCYMMLYVICLWIVLRYIGLNEATRFSAPSEGRSPEHQHTNTTRSKKLPKPTKIYIKADPGIENLAFPSKIE